jgi:methyltransferase family protein
MALFHFKSTTYKSLSVTVMDPKAFSLTPELLGLILNKAKPLGHREQKETLNLGFGFLYYGLVRSLRPAHTVVIGSGYGFSVVCLALGCKDNGFGKVSFVDPSYSLLKDGPFKTVGGAGKWSHPQKVQHHFQQFGVEDVVTHYKLKSDTFFPAYSELGLPGIDLGFVDGNHSLEHVRYDFLNLSAHGHKNSYVFLHDTNIYVREKIHHSGVKRWLNTLKKEKDYFEVINFPFSSGVALVRILQDKNWEPRD